MGGADPDTAAGGTGRKAERGHRPGRGLCRGIGMRPTTRIAYGAGGYVKAGGAGRNTEISCVLYKMIDDG